MVAETRIVGKAAHNKRMEPTRQLSRTIVTAARGSFVSVMHEE
jgi:hypothetical protein